MKKITLFALFTVFASCAGKKAQWVCPYGDVELSNIYHDSKDTSKSPQVDVSYFQDDKKDTLWTVSTHWGSAGTGHSHIPKDSVCLDIAWQLNAIDLYRKGRKLSPHSDNHIYHRLFDVWEKRN